jgi:hypothetical protein
VIEATGQQPELRILEFNGTLRTAAALSKGIEFSYESSSGAIAVLDKKPATVEVDGERSQPKTLENQGRHILMLPRGQHLVKIESTDP